MPRESQAARRERAHEIVKRLKIHYPESKISLEYGNDVQLLVAVILSAQCTDAMVNKVTKPLFTDLRTAQDFADVSQEELERRIRPTGFYRQKAKNIRAAARRIVEAYDGRVPATMEDLLTLPGVARKTANVVLWNAHDRPDGIAVDTHVARVTRLLRLTRHEDPVKIERDLVKLVPPEDWGHFTHLVIDHGRAICIARRPRCEACFLNDLCPSSRV